MSASGTIAIVPVKALAEAKSRLAPVLSPAARRRLVVQMLGDVLAALAATPAVTRTLVVTPDAEVAAIARAQGAEIIHEAHADQSQWRAADRAARERLPARCPLPHPASRRPAGDAGRDRGAAWTAGRSSPHRVMIAPSHDGGGTNALVLNDHDIMGPSFGPDSFKRHLEMAQALHLNPRVVRLPGLGFDIDMPEDLRRLSAVERYRWLDAERRRIGQPRDFRHIGENYADDAVRGYRSPACEWLGWRAAVARRGSRALPGVRIRPL